MTYVYCPQYFCFLYNHCVIIYLLDDNIWSPVEIFSRMIILRDKTRQELITPIAYLLKSSFFGGGRGRG